MKHRAHAKVRTAFEEHQSLQSLKVLVEKGIRACKAQNVAMLMCLCRCGCCSGLEEVLGVQLPKDLSSDEAQQALAKLVSILACTVEYACAFKPGCLMSHNWLHTPDFEV